MATALRPIGHEDRLSLVDHLDELRRRLIICVVTLIAAFAFCFWQNDAVLDIVKHPAESTQNLNSNKPSKDPREQVARFQREQGDALRATAPALAEVARSLRGLTADRGLSIDQTSTLRAAAVALDRASEQTRQAARAEPRNPERKLVTLGVAEPFTSTITIALYAALLLAMPMLLYQAYAFVLPAFTPGERRIAVPLMFMVPLLFIAGVAFGYFVVLDRAVHFLQNFNDDSFDILLQAKDYFRFTVLFVASIGLLFQIPVAVLAVTRLGILTPKQLAGHRGYVILAISVLAAVATPTPDPVTMTLAMGPLIVLFELSILVTRWLERIAPARPRFGDDEDEPELETLHSDRED
jgi:sec-independent protein translocase protein TatC